MDRDEEVLKIDMFLQVC